jgi:Xaa-Pro aminopeptidase
MKSDLDSIMQSQDIDALLITGPAQHNPAMFYLTGGGHMTHADLIKKRGEAPILFYNSMERDEAARTGLLTRNLGDYRLVELIKQTGSSIQAHALRYQKMLVDAGVTAGRVALYGKRDAGEIFAIFSSLQALLPEITFVGQLDDSLLLDAMATKDEGEVERIRRMGKITVDVVGEVADLLTSQKVKDETLVRPDGQPLTIGDVKTQINLWLTERGAENPEGTIFSIGRDAGVPHSTGTAADPIRLGQTIVFDIFPCEQGGGYYYDFTRTWCVGYAPDEVLSLYEDVYQVYYQLLGELKAGTPCPDYQRRTCELFEERGHPTIHSDPQTMNGYVHSLGHGVGLHVHERPWFGRNASTLDVLVPGAVFTMEPGLYYPERGMGVRLEDSLWVRPDGQMEILADFPMDLVLPVGSRRRSGGRPEVLE